MPFIARLAALAFAIVLIAATSGTAQQVDLVLNLEPGKTYRNTMTMEQKITQSLGGVDQQMQQTMGIGMSQKVLKKHADGSYDIAATYDWVTLKHPQMNIDYDSRKAQQGQGNPLVAAFAAMVGHGFEMTMTPRGKITELRGVEAMLDKMIEGMPAAPGLDKGQMKQMMSQQFGDKAIKSAIESSTPLPEKAVNIGETWTKTMSMPGTASQMTTKYMLASVENGAARINASSSIAPDPNAKPIEVPGGSTMKQNLTGSQSGFLMIDTATGWLKRSQMQQDISGDATITNPGLGEMKIPMTIKSSITITDE